MSVPTPWGGASGTPLQFKPLPREIGKKKSRMEKLKTCTPKIGQKITCCEGQIDPSSISVLCWAVFEQQMGNIYGKHIDAMPSNYSM